MIDAGPAIAIKAQLDLADLSVVRSLPDDALVELPCEFTEGPYTRYAATPGELRALIREMIAPYPDCSPQIFESHVEHETEHAVAASAVGCTGRFGFTVAPAPGKDGLYASAVYEVMSRAAVTKLALAAITAAPALLSDGDLVDLNRMGYRDAADVAGRIRASGQPLPIPASVRRGRA